MLSAYLSLGPGPVVHYKLQILTLNDCKAEMPKISRRRKCKCFLIYTSNHNLPVLTLQITEYFTFKVYLVLGITVTINTDIEAADIQLIIKPPTSTNRRNNGA